MDITITIPVANEAAVIAGFLAEVPQDAESVLSNKDWIAQQFQNWFNKKQATGTRALAADAAVVVADAFKQ
jgi:hypothetical protein